MRGLAPYVDIWLAETLGSSREAEAAAAAVAGDRRPLWISFTLADDVDRGEPPRLRSGEAVGPVAARAAELGAEVLLFNCSPPERMGAALAEAAGCGLPTGAYANALPPQGDEARANETLHEIRQDLSPASYLAFARGWVEQGAAYVGGCCRHHAAAHRGARRGLRPPLSAGIALR